MGGDGGEGQLAGGAHIEVVGRGEGVGGGGGGGAWRGKAHFSARRMGAEWATHWLAKENNSGNCLAGVIGFAYKGRPLIQPTVPVLLRSVVHTGGALAPRPRRCCQQFCLRPRLLALVRRVPVA